MAAPPAGILKKQQQEHHQRRLRQRERRQQQRRRIRWLQSVRDVANRFYQGMTHPGTASGRPSVWPPPRKKGEPPGGGAGGGSGEEEKGGTEGEEGAGPEDALQAFFRSNPDALRQLFAQFMAARGGGKGGGGRDSGGRGGGRGGGGGGMGGMPLASRGRRHHVCVALREGPRRPKPQDRLMRPRR